jgi:hypothetical protein
MKKLTFVLTILVFITCISCKKEGTGGDANITANIAHHGFGIKGATLYIKFDAKEKPANPTTDYDLKIETSASETHAHIDGLKWGEYYLYATGFDSTIMLPVKGGIPFTINHKDRKKEITTEVPVTED